MNERLKSFLKDGNYAYGVIVHPQACTAQQVAHRIHESEKALAETFILEANDSQIR